MATSAQKLLNFGQLLQSKLVGTPCNIKIKTYRKSKIREAKYQGKSTFFNLIRTLLIMTKRRVCKVFRWSLWSLDFDGLLWAAFSVESCKNLLAGSERSRSFWNAGGLPSSIVARRESRLLSSLWGCYSAGTKKRNWRKKRCNHFHFMNTIEAS